MPWSPAWTTTSSPLSKRIRLRSSASAGGVVSSQLTLSVGTARGRRRCRICRSPRRRRRKRCGRCRRGGVCVSGRDGHVEVDRVGGDAGDGTFFAPEVAADDAGLRAVVLGGDGDFGGFDFLVMRGGHLERGGEIRPQLEAVHAARFVALGHFLVDDAAAGGHPLDVARFDGAVVADAVGVVDGAGEDVGDGFDAAMRVPGEAGEVVGGDVVAEIVEQEEGVEIGGVAEAERAAEVDAGAFHGGLGFDDFVDGSN